jgi:exopolysaccharide biosynthesis polyprenyl glycosylphosphotransferase
MSTTDFEALTRVRAINQSNTAVRRVLVVGAGPAARALADQLSESQNFELVACVESDFEGIPNLVQEKQIDEIFLAPEDSWEQQLITELTRRGSSVTVRAVPSYYDVLRSHERITSVGDIALLELTHLKGLFDFCKRIVDFTVSLIVIVLCAPLFGLLALLIKLTSPGPVLFAQERVGHNAKNFILYKFRTMRVDAEKETGPVLSAGKEDNRLTPIGRWLRLTRCDELPQLVNVLRGEMSLIGPRPERPVFVDKFTDHDPIYHLRHQIRPGITGLAQVLGGYHTTAWDKLRFDLFYLANRSFLLDIMIVFKTLVRIFIKPNGA